MLTEQTISKVQLDEFNSNIFSSIDENSFHTQYVHTTLHIFYFILFQMIFFPEACDFICDNKQDTLKSAESILEGDTMKMYKKLALQHNVWMSMGGLHEKVICHCVQKKIRLCRSASRSETQTLVLVTVTVKYREFNGFFPFKKYIKKFSLQFNKRDTSL